VETIVSRLQHAGYVFRDPDSPGRPLEPPVAGTEGIVDALERLVGTMPLSLRAWYTVVGSVSLRGAHPAWPAPPAVLPDPLEVTSPAIVLERCARWLDGMRPGDGYDWPDILIGGDGLHKAGYSGGPAYTIAVPNASVDGRLRGWYHEATFVDYLRICFAWGGFPGFARYDTRPTEMIAYLSEGLQPI
jgi:hypothetical protein